MELPFEIWNRIFDQCDSFKAKRKLYDALPAAFRIQYPKFLVPDGDKYLMKYLSIDDEKEVRLSLKIGGHWSSDLQPILFKENRLFIKNIESAFKYKDVPKTLDELFDFDKKIYEYYLSILKNIRLNSKRLNISFTNWTFLLFFKHIITR